MAVHFRPADHETRHVTRLLENSNHTIFEPIISVDRVHLDDAPRAWAYAIEMLDGATWTIKQARSKHARCYDLYGDLGRAKDALYKWATRIEREERKGTHTTDGIGG